MSPSGSSFKAKLDNPIEVDGKALLPKGTLVEGHLGNNSARRMMRRGALRMIFDRLKRPDGTVQPRSVQALISESISAKADNERTVNPSASKKRLAIQFSGTAQVAKLADDVSEGPWPPAQAVHDGMAWPRALHFSCCKKVAR